MEKFLKQLELIEDVPSEVKNIAFLIDFKLKCDKVLNKIKANLLLDNISALENSLRINDINNEILNRELNKLKNELYAILDYFKNQEKLLA